VSSSWGVLVAQRQCLSLVGASLVSYGVEHFIPMVENLKIVRGRHVRDYEPILGDYILIAISSCWKELCSLRGVAGILIDSVSGMPAQVLPHEMERMRAMCNSDGVYSQPEKVFELTYGQRVKPKDGFFSKQVGIYEGRTKRGDHTALFCLFGKEQRVTFKSGDLIGL
jgi:transcription antitermination factor NusG